MARREAVQEIYASSDLAKVGELLRRYHVGYVYVGWLERQTYGGPGLTKVPPQLTKGHYKPRAGAPVTRVAGDEIAARVTNLITKRNPADRISSIPAPSACRCACSVDADFLDFQTC